jgi:hypothetical protein
MPYSNLETGPYRSCCSLKPEMILLNFEHQITTKNCTIWKEVWNLPRKVHLYLIVYVDLTIYLLICV